MQDVNNSIYNYGDYRDFISDYYQGKKRENKNYSLTVFANQVNQSKMAIKYIIDKVRHISEENIPLFSSALKLNDSETKYFSNLVMFNKAKTEESRNLYFKKMLSAKESPFKDLYLKDTDMGYMAKWFYPAIAEMSYMKGFVEDPNIIKKRLFFNVSIEDIREALQFLKTNGYLKNSEKLGNKIKVPNNLKNHIYKQFTIQQVELAKDAISTQNQADREISNITISVNEEKYNLAKKMIDEFRQNLHDLLANNDECERVIQINMQLFTLAKNGEEKCTNL